MNTKDFDSGNLINFKDLADRIKSISDSVEADSETDLFQDKALLDFFNQLLSESLSEPDEPLSEEELSDEIVDNFSTLIKALGIDKFSFFRFLRYDYPREIIIDGKEYDLDSAFTHDDAEATEALCAIDCLLADSGDDIETTLKNTERKINFRNKE